jgi:hypothetical protein
VFVALLSMPLLLLLRPRKSPSATIAVAEA